MERANHINIAMIEDIGTNGTATSKGVTCTEQNKQPCGSTVSFHNVQYKVQLRSGFCKKTSSPKEILVDLNGIMRPGLNAILGPTGSGKSSFLDILAARKDPSGLSGEVLIDGAPQPPNFKCLSGYVVQEDVVMGTLTVRENLRFSAALRLPSAVPQGEKEARVNHLIKELGLTKVADSKVGTQMIRGISGGERKRTNIGMELIIDPSVLFLDEPTTGLDASTANSVLLLLKRMANHGRTIIMSIHQPRYSIYRLFDTLTLLVSGKMVYHGPAPNALDYFANIGYPCEPHNNPADFFLDVINGDFTGATMTKVHGSEDLDFEELSSSTQSIEKHLIEEYRNCSYFSDTQAELERIVQDKEYILRPKSRTITYNSSFFHQLRWVLKRTFQNLMLNPQTSVAQLGVNIFLALIVGAIFFGIKDDQSGIQNRMGALFFITTNQCFSTVSAAELFIVERQLFVHEYISGYYRVSVYFLSKILSDITLRTFTSVIFSCIVYFLIGLKSTVSAFFIFTLTVTLVAYTATAMTMAISADQSVVALANIFMTITFVFMMIFSGLLVNLPSIMDWLAWLKYFSIPRYGLAALNINEFVGLKFCEEAVRRDANMSAGASNCSMSTAALTCTGEQYLDYLGIEYTTWGLWENHTALTVMSFVFLLIAYLKLRYIKKFT
ncbi:broad substrate specificity ATP-binding cassette transporter ABCG2d [Hippoglossus stenolepis]|uniref:broad substrate specificity ATP-binding cassette transporter ABCG2d n=1 Tax=Hippoglossus stenolepis TaxID=195615 RepID=UPI001FAEB03B|nr:broad substrate specificity ATP-binding cassette transporter ABCG2d [Hippoglossus stenolepis]XP_047194354.1 broad substrate specificity ATP-binding cassette transporter ABCG2d [Hippoglossus stenolepis]